MYEQGTVIEDNVYSIEKYKAILKDNEKFSPHALSRWAGAEKTEIPLSADCGATPTIPFNGSILNVQDRVMYYHKLMDEFESAAYIPEILKKAFRQWP